MTFRHVPRISRHLECFAGDPCCPQILQAVRALLAGCYVRVHLAFEEQSPRSESGSPFQQKTSSVAQQGSWHDRSGVRDPPSPCLAEGTAAQLRPRSPVPPATAWEKGGKRIHEETRGKNRQAE